MNTYKFRQNLSTSGERVRETRFFEQVKAKIPRQREPAGVSGIAAGGGLQRLWGQKQNALSRPAPRQALADLAVGLVPAQQLVGHFAAVIAAHQHADQG